MRTEMTNIHDDMIELWQLLYICKAEKTHLNDKIVLGGGGGGGVMCLTNRCRQTTKDRGFKFALFER